MGEQDERFENMKSCPPLSTISIATYRIGLESVIFSHN